MHDTLKAATEIRRNTPGAGLATVCAVDGSSYRRPGARLVLTPEGHRKGSISGGCLEEDLALRLQAVMRSNASVTLVYDTTQENELIWGVGLGCNGRVTLLLESTTAIPESLAFAEAAAQRRSDCVLVTIYEAEESTLLGTGLAMSRDGRQWAGPWPERLLSAADAAARDALMNSRSTWLRLDQLPGAPRIFVEFIEPPPRLVIFGAGDDAQPLASLASSLGWIVTVVDPRTAYATSARFPSADEVFPLRPEEGLDRVAFDARTCAVVMTHHYVHDLPFLRLLLNQDLRYLGLLGPRKRAERMLGELRDEGVVPSGDMLDRLHAPVGLDLGGDTPETVALSMLAEMQSVLEKRDGRPLRERQRPIHG